MLRELGEAVRSRRVGARELVALALERIDRLDREIGAVVMIQAEEAVAEARAADERTARGEDPGALAGIPCLIKDIEDLRGMPTTFGSLLFRDAPPADRDGLMASRLRAAGAIAVGKSNTPEFAAEGFTDNRLFGPTRNPWAPERSPGGSSGGSGAAVAAGMVPIATATDTGGSIRIPAAFCGLVGIKPTNGVVELDPALCWPDLTTSGPLAATVDDIRLLLDVAAGGPGSVSGRRPASGAPGDDRPSRRTRPRRVIALPRFFPWGPLPETVAPSFEGALRSVERSLELPVEPMDPDDLFGSGNPEDDWALWTAPELVAWLGRSRAEASLELLHPAVRRFVERGLRTTIDDYLAARERCRRYARRLEGLLGAHGLIASPTLASEGWLADGSMPGAGEPGPPPPEAYNTSLQNLTGHPAVTVPAGRLPNGLPFGLQFTGPRFADGVLLDVAGAWERASPWPATAEGYVPFAL